MSTRWISKGSTRVADDAEQAVAFFKKAFDAQSHQNQNVKSHSSRNSNRVQI